MYLLLPLVSQQTPVDTRGTHTPPFKSRGYRVCTEPSLLLGPEVAPLKHLCARSPRQGSKETHFRVGWQCCAGGGSCGDPGVTLSMLCVHGAGRGQHPGELTEPSPVGVQALQGTAGRPRGFKNNKQNPFEASDVAGCPQCPTLICLHLYTSKAFINTLSLSSLGNTL